MILIWMNFITLEDSRHTKEGCFNLIAFLTCWSQHRSSLNKGAKRRVNTSHESNKLKHLLEEIDKNEPMATIT